MIPSEGIRPLSPASISRVASRIWSIRVTTMTTAKRTGLVCPTCRPAVAIIERETDDAIRCKACGHRWNTAKR